MKDYYICISNISAQRAAEILNELPKQQIDRYIKNTTQMVTGQIHHINSWQLVDSKNPSGNFDLIACVTVQE